ncbi:MAG: glucose PTS transporter subunit IIA [Ancrocorticia sp.]
MPQSPAAAIVAAVGGPGNIKSLTHCATRLRFELVDATLVSSDALDNIDAVMGSVPQSGDRYQVIIGGAVASMFKDINNLPEMKGAGASADDIKAAAREKGPRGKHAWMDNFFEFLADSFRPILGVLLGASLIIAFAAVMDAAGVQDFRAAEKPAGWMLVDAMWRSVFYFLPIMVAYNASKKLDIDPWLGGAIMAALMTPEFMNIKEGLSDVTCTTNETLGTTACQANIFGLPMILNGGGYGGNVFVPLMMAGVLALVYRAVKKIIPESLHLVFVPFLSMLVMIPVTALVLGPLGVWLGSGLGTILAWLNNSAPIVFAILIPMLYPFLVPLGLHWPLNALMLINIDTLGYDFIQGPMGAWNFACFGATAGVLVIAMREKDKQMRQTATGALVAGLAGGISEPSLYGIHLRFARIYPRMLTGCFLGGLTIGVGSMITGGNGVLASAFAFTSLLTIPLFSPVWLYMIAIAVAFFVAMFAVIFTDYRTPEQKEEVRARIAAETAPAASAAPVAAAAPAGGVAVATAPAKTLKPAMVPGTVTEIASPMKGKIIPLAEVPDAGFASGAVGKGVGIDPSEGTVVSPGDGTIILTFPTGHAVGIRLDSGVEMLVHIGIDTVNMEGKGFDVHVAKGDKVTTGDPLVSFDRAAIEAAGYSAITPVLVTNHRKFGSVEQDASGVTGFGDQLLKVTAKDA